MKHYHIATIRKKRLEELRSTHGQASMLTIQFLIETAIQPGADMIELE